MKNFLRKLKDNVVDLLLSFHPEEGAKPQVVALLIGVPLVGIAIASMLLGNYRTGIISLITACLTLVCYFAALAGVKKDIIYIAISALSIIYFLLALYYGFGNGMGLIWSMFIPGTLMSFMGYKRGIWLSIIEAFVLVAYLFVPQINEGMFYYPLGYKIRYLLIYLNIVVTGYVVLAAEEKLYTQAHTMTDKYRFLCAHDYLTGLKNRYNMRQEFTEMAKDAEKMSVIMFDIDYFKRVNDNYSHESGDTVLKELAKTVSDAVPEGVELYRWGGEEFVMYTRNSDGYAIAEAVRMVVSKKLFNTVQTAKADAEKIKITVSCGVTAQARPDDGEYDYDGLLRQADINLYAAKNNGRDQTVASEL